MALEPILLKPIRPNVGIEAAYRRRLKKIIGEMHASVLYWVAASYRANEPEMSADELPATALKGAFRKLSRRWMRNFNEASPKLADHFARSIADRSDRNLRKILKEGGFSVEFKMTRGMRDVLGATVAQNVSLIKSIPQEYLAKVEGAVMRSVQTGRDLATLTKEIKAAHAVSDRRAQLIARDQSNKATSALGRVRKVELGIAEEVWVHSHAGKVPRPTHVKMDGERFDIKVGMYDEAEGRNVFPGELINCRCVSRPVIEGFS